MNTTALKNNIASNKRIIALFVLLLLSSVKMFGQVKNEIVAPAIIMTENVMVANENTNSQMEFVSWFMGSKQVQMNDGTKSSNTISTNGSGKKQFINNGMTPNKILSRTFLKKAINHDSTIA